MVLLKTADHLSEGEKKIQLHRLVFILGFFKRCTFVAVEVDCLIDEANRVLFPVPDKVFLISTLPLNSRVALPLLFQLD